MSSCIEIERDSNDLSSETCNKARAMFSQQPCTTIWQHIEIVKFRDPPLEKNVPFKIYLAPDTACSLFAYFEHCA